MGTFINLNAHYMSIPRSARGYAPHDFIHFKVAHPNLDPRMLCVNIEDLSPEGQFKMGTIQETMKIPNIYLPQPHAKVWVNGITKDGQQISFWGRMSRGSTFVLDKGEGGHHFMTSFTDNNGCGCCSNTHVSRY